MEVQTESERVQHSRKVVLEFLGSSVDLSLAGPQVPNGDAARYAERYGADPARFGPPAPLPRPTSATIGTPATTTPRTAPRLPSPAPSPSP